MTLDDTARILRTLRADLVEEQSTADERGQHWATRTTSLILAAIDQRLHNISVAEDFHDRAARSTP